MYPTDINYILRHSSKVHVLGHVRNGIVFFLSTPAVYSLLINYCVFFFFSFNELNWYFAICTPVGLPYIRLIPKVTAVAGETLHLKCPVAGYPIEEIHWERGTYSWYFYRLLDIYGSISFVNSENESKNTQ